ncbi:MAG: hypothetical protein ACOYOA_09770 [Saprospiraceae bacterium]
MSKSNKNKKEFPLKAESSGRVAGKPAESSGNQWIWIAAVLAITFFCFYPTLDNAFVNWDDDVNLLENSNTEVLDAQHIKAIFTDRVIGNYNPMPVLTLAIERHFVGLEPRLYHINNLLLHLFATFFVFLILMQLGLKAMPAAVGALLFGIHPMRVESVAWVTERKDVLLAAFYLPAIYCYIKSIKIPEKRTYYLILTGILFVFALLSKIQAVALPLTMLAIDYLLLEDFKFKYIIDKALFFILSAVVGFLGIYFLKDNGSLQDVAGYSFIDRLLIGFYTLNVYLMKFIYPYEMSCLYPYPGKLDFKFFISPLGVALFFAAIFWLWKTGYKAWVFGLLFFFVNVVFLLQVLGAGQAFLADRFTYIPYFGLFFIVAYYINHFEIKSSGKFNILLGIVGAFLFFSSFKTRQQCDVWTDGGTLWTKALEYYPESDLPWTNRARFYRENKKDYLKAIEGYDSAIAIKPKMEALNSRGKTYFDLAGYPELMQKLKLTTAECTKKALDDYNFAFQQDTSFVEPKTLAEVYANRGAAYGRYASETGDKSYLQNSKSDIYNAIRIDPKNENSYLNGYLVNSELGNFEEAINCIDKYLAIKPGESDMYYERGVSNRRLEKDDLAIPDLENAIRYGEIERKSKEKKLIERGTLICGASQNELARIYFRKGNLVEAKKRIEQAQALQFPGIDQEIVKSVQNL